VAWDMWNGFFAFCSEQRASGGVFANVFVGFGRGRSLIFYGCAMFIVWME